MKKIINLLVLLILFSCGEEGSGVLPWPPADIYLGTSGGLSISSNNLTFSQSPAYATLN